MAKILVMFTGGTIGSSHQGNWISLDSSAKYTLINNYYKKYGKTVEFDIVSPYTILSENLTGTEITELVRCVNFYGKKAYDGIIVAHGTDTIQYSAAALSFTLENFNLPVVLVSANFPLDNEKSNGNINFEAAVSFIVKNAGCGVFVSYKNTTKDAVDFHYGTRLLSHMETFDDLYSIDGEAYAYYENDEIKLNSEFKSVYRKITCGNVEFCTEPKILVINSMPGDSFSYDIDQYNAVIFKPYHSGTLNTENRNLKEFCKKAKKLSVPIFPVNLRSEFIYDSTKIYNELGFIQLPLCSFPSIYMKAWIGISLKKELRNFVEEPIAGEFLV